MSDPPRLMTPWRIVLTAVSVAAASAVIVAVLAQPANRNHDPLIPRHLENAKFDPSPPMASAPETITRVWSDLKQQSYEAGGFLKSLLPTEAGTLWLSVIISIVVGLDTANITNPLNLELLSTLVVGVLLFSVMRFFNLLNDPVYLRVMDWVFTGVVAVSLWLFGRAMWRVRHPHQQAWRPNLPARSLMLLTALLLTLNALTVVIREPDDAGFYTNLGGQRLRERGMFPYGDKLLSGSAAAAYGPVLFMSHVPAQVMIDPSKVNPESQNHMLMRGDVYNLPPMLATQLTTLAFHLLGVAALVIAVRRLAGDQVAWGLAALYCGSAYVLGVGGPREMVGGLTFISHIAAPSLALTAFALLDSPMLAGVFLALSAATVFYPMFFVPAWVGYYWPQRKAMLRFLAGLALATTIVGVPVLALSRSTHGQSRLATIAQDTLGHHQGSDAYGDAPFGFWGGRSGIRGWLQKEMVPGQALTTPMFLVVLLFAGCAFFPARGATPQQLALLSAAAAILTVTWKILGTGVYVTWYYPFLLIGFFAARPRTEFPVATCQLPVESPVESLSLKFPVRER